MMCHKIGRSPMRSIGLGISSETSRIRTPRPPQKITTFMIIRCPHEARAATGEEFRSSDQVLPGCFSLGNSLWARGGWVGALIIPGHVVPGGRLLPAQGLRV